MTGSSTAGGGAAAVAAPEPRTPPSTAPARVEALAALLARSHASSPGTAPRDRRAVRRVVADARVLRSAYRTIAAAVRSREGIAPAEEWIVDNFHLLDEQVRILADDLPDRLACGLPAVAGQDGGPRVAALMSELVERLDAAVDLEAMRRFLKAYQAAAPLQVRELWSIPVFLRLALVRKVRHMAEHLLRRREVRRAANVLADRLLDEDRRDSSLPSDIEQLPTAFAVQLVQRLRDRDPSATPAVAWLRDRLAREGRSAEDAVRDEHAQQVAIQGTVRNAVTSLRLLAALDWDELLEEVCVVTSALVAGGIGEVDFRTRDMYRHAVEELAEEAKLEEGEVARRAAAMARGQEGARCDPGYFLVDGGREALEQSAGASLPLRRRAARALLRTPAPAYLAALLVATLVALAIPLLFARGGSRASLLLVALAAILPASEAAVTLVNRIVTAAIPPRRLPRLALSGGVTDELATMVVVPTMLTSAADVAEQIDLLEVHFLANPRGAVRLALLSDWPDSDREVDDDDLGILEQARHGIAALNERHAPLADGSERFHLLHRRRLWNASEGRFMGWERKRGKLAELNRLLRGATDTSFLPGTELPRGIRYVLTLDADTRLPRDVVSKLVGTLAHPLNRAVLDPATGRVVAGYGILQPRVSPALPGHEGTLFQRLYSGPGGLDPYAFAVSDVYQDLFGEAVYTGKGLYDVDAFESSLRDRVPENSLLSHDLFEGLHARVALVSDVELFESFPHHLEVAEARAHRWTRGDWQLLPWILPRGRDGFGVVGHWKLLDNLRRSLVAPASLATLALAWLLPGVDPLPWLAFVGAVALLPGLLSFARSARARRGVSLLRRLRAAVSELALAASQAFVGFATLAYRSWLTGDAILRTLVRLYVTRRNLLQWVTVAQAHRMVDLSPSAMYARMAGAAAFASVLGAAVVAFRPESAPLAIPCIALWIISPTVARIASAPPPARRGLDPADAAVLRAVARRTWRLFARWVGPDENHLPPDNVQEEPSLVVAHRTSPTNVGMYLLSVVAARDFGWISLTECVARIEATLETMDRLESHRGHLLNWYDTQSLRPLTPRYVSTVDSGNLAASLIVLSEACDEIRRSPLSWRGVLPGVRDALHLVRDAADDLEASSRGDRRERGVRPTLALGAELLETTRRLERLAEADLPADAVRAVRDLESSVEALQDIVQAHGLEHGEAPLLDLLESVRELRGAVAAVRSDAELASASPGEGAPGDAAAALAERLRSIASRSRERSAGMDWSFLYDRDRRLLTIGYRVEDAKPDTSFYDLLASEARLTTFLAVASGQLPTSSWSQLGRRLTPVGWGMALVSWSGSMFEYLMPDLLMRAPEGSLLWESSRRAVECHMRYGRRRGVPWGISESASSDRNEDASYRYQAYGVPALGLKRGLAEDLVIAPYATGLAAMVDAAGAARNFRELVKLGAFGALGPYEAVDFTSSRLPEKRSHIVVRTFMAHHQGMMLVSLANVLQGDRMKLRFHRDPRVRATELLLQERMPRCAPASRVRESSLGRSERTQDLAVPVLRTFRSPHDSPPRAHFLGNGRYGVMVTASGCGWSRLGEMAVTRFRPDHTCEGSGSFVWLRDVGSGHVWSAGHHPSCVEAERYQVTYAEDRVTIERRDGPYRTSLEIVVAAPDDAEVRRVTVTNRGSRVREVDVTSYAEVVMAPWEADAAHRAFSGLFVETQWLPARGVLLASRRPREEGAPRPWLAHVTSVEGEAIGAAACDTERRRFRGRGRALRDAPGPGSVAGNDDGFVLDPIISLRRRVRLAPGGMARVTFTTLVAPNREAAVELADRYAEPDVFARAEGLSWTQAHLELRHLALSSEDAHIAQRLGSRLVFPDDRMRSPEALRRNTTRGPSGLWAHRLSGKLPILVARIDDAADRDVVRQLLRAQEYLRMKGLPFDLVVLNEQQPTYGQDLHDLLEAQVRSAAPHGERRGAVVLLRADHVAPEERLHLRACAAVEIHAHRGTLAQQLAVRSTEAAAAPASPSREFSPVDPHVRSRPSDGLVHWNGTGGFTRDGREYVVVLTEDRVTPAPWINVVANPELGFTISESGAGFSWCRNSRLNQLTPWSNDPVADPVSEAIYVRDEDTLEAWTPTASPIRTSGSYVARHGQGYSRFEHESHGIALELLLLVAPGDPVKVARLRLANRSRRPRQLSVWAYVEWVLGESRDELAPHVVTSLDEETGALLARNPWNEAFPGVAFLAMSPQALGASGDREELLGRNGDVSRPAALGRPFGLSGRVGAGLDPCGALATRVDLAPHQEAEVVVLLGQVPSVDVVRKLVPRYLRARGEELLAAVTSAWDEMLGTIEVETPDGALDLMLNRWLLYQTLACRLWGRTSCYQNGGAYGFRDQLQDVTALLVARPDLAREHILRAAARQFREGDVQHWWHPPAGQGIRTRISDSHLWLPYATCRYVEATGDAACLEQEVPFLEGPALGPEQTEAYFQPAVSEESGSLWEHCARAVDRALTKGQHGLPLMGTGDWNDGMNRVGIGGRGESVWLGWFLLRVIEDLLPEARRRDAHRAARWETHASELRWALEEHGWDGGWYRRAFMDDGTPIGSAARAECRIDSIAQSWAVLSGAGRGDRCHQAMDAVERQLLLRDAGLLLLFTPPFDRTPLEPGYVKAYPPGIRENGGQYTHAAAWVIMALVKLGEGDRAAQLLGLLNPIRHTATRAGVQRYRTEPYVVAADVGASPRHPGRGGWSWYTGSAAWMYRAGVESLLGVQLLGSGIQIDPCIPRTWPSFRVTIRRGTRRVAIRVENPEGVNRGVVRATLDGAALPAGVASFQGTGCRIELPADGRDHELLVLLGRPVATPPPEEGGSAPATRR